MLWLLCCFTYGCLVRDDLSKTSKQNMCVTHRKHVNLTCTVSDGGLMATENYLPLRSALIGFYGTLYSCHLKKFSQLTWYWFITCHITLNVDLQYAVEGVVCITVNASWLYYVSSVCLISSQFLQVSFMHYMGMCVFSSPICLMMIVIICVLYLIIIIKSEVVPISIVYG